MLRHARSFWLVSSWLLACGGEVPATGGSGGGGEAAGAAGAGASGGEGGAGASGGAGGAGGEAGAGGALTGGAGGVGGEGGAGGGWPTCDVPPADLPVSTISQVWDADPADPTEFWIPGVFVSAVSGGGCVDNGSCQIFVQQAESFPSLAAAAHQGLRIAITPAVASYFTGIEVGDRIDLRAFAVRDTDGGKNELFFFVTSNLPGCAAVVGAGTPVPVTATLADLTVDAYEETIGPVLVRVETVSGNPNMPGQTFGLWETGSPIDPKNTDITSLSPFFLATQAFAGLTDGVNTNFQFVVGVFALFTPPADPLVKYRHVYPRTDAEYPIAN
jgi:hypothetical protein